jgi:hypothetical protein
MSRYQLSGNRAALAAAAIIAEDFNRTGDIGPVNGPLADLTDRVRAVRGVLSTAANYRFPPQRELTNALHAFIRADRSARRDLEAYAVKLRASAPSYFDDTRAGIIAIAERVENLVATFLNGEN